MNFLKLILLSNSRKIRKLGDQVLRISHEFPEKHSGEILRNFVGKIFWEFLRNFSKLSLKTVISQKYLIWGPILGNFSRIFKELVTGNDSREIPRKFLIIEIFRIKAGKYQIDFYLVSWNQGYDTRKVILEVYEYLVLLCTVSSRYNVNTRQMSKPDILSIFHIKINEKFWS